MEKWVVTAKGADFQKIGRTFGIDPVIARLIRNRDVVGDEAVRQYLFGTMDELPSPWLLKDMKKAVEIIREKVRQKKKIRIIGDYDIDGVTWGRIASFLPSLMSTLTMRFPHLTGNL